MLVCGWLVARSSACPLIVVLLIDIEFSFFGFLDAVIVKRMAPIFAGETSPVAVESGPWIPYSAIHGGFVGPFAIFECGGGRRVMIWDEGSTSLARLRWVTSPGVWNST